jgi:hypothetical protein
MRAPRGGISGEVRDQVGWAKAHAEPPPQFALARAPCPRVQPCCISRRVGTARKRAPLPTLHRTMSNSPTCRLRLRISAVAPLDYDFPRANLSAPGSRPLRQRLPGGRRNRYRATRTHPLPQSCLGARPGPGAAGDRVAAARTGAPAASARAQPPEPQPVDERVQDRRQRGIIRGACIKRGGRIDRSFPCSSHLAQAFRSRGALARRM